MVEQKAPGTEKSLISARMAAWSSVVEETSRPVAQGCQDSATRTVYMTSPPAARRLRHTWERDSTPLWRELASFCPASRDRQHWGRHGHPGSARRETEGGAAGTTGREPSSFLPDVRANAARELRTRIRTSIEAENTDEGTPAGRTRSPVGKQPPGTAVPVVYDVGSPRVKVPEALGNSKAESPTWAPPVLLQSGVLVKDSETLTLWSLGS